MISAVQRRWHEILNLFGKVANTRNSLSDDVDDSEARCKENMRKTQKIMSREVNITSLLSVRLAPSAESRASSPTTSQPVHHRSSAD